MATVFMPMFYQRLAVVQATALWQGSWLWPTIRRLGQDLSDHIPFNCHDNASTMPTCPVSWFSCLNILPAYVTCITLIYTTKYHIQWNTTNKSANSTLSWLWNNMGYKRSIAAILLRCEVPVCSSMIYMKMNNHLSKLVGAQVTFSAWSVYILRDVK